MIEEGAATETNIPLIGSRTDFKIINEGSFEDFKAEVKKVCATIML